MAAQLDYPDGTYQLMGTSLTAGLVVDRGVVVRTAPILARWAAGRPIDEVVVEAMRRGVTVQLVGPGTD